MGALPFNVFKSPHAWKIGMFGGKSWPRFCSWDPNFLWKGRFFWWGCMKNISYQKDPKLIFRAVSCDFADFAEYETCSQRTPKTMLGSFTFLAHLCNFHKQKTTGFKTSSLLNVVECHMEREKRKTPLYEYFSRVCIILQTFQHFTSEKQLY